MGFLHIGLISSSYAQENVGIGTATPDPSALLDLTVPDPVSNPMGMLLPRLTTAQRTGMTLGAAQQGLVVYDSDVDSVFVWKGTAWEGLGGSSATVDLQTAYDNGNTINTTAGTPLSISGVEPLTITTSGGIQFPNNGSLSQSGSELSLSISGTGGPLVGNENNPGSISSISPGIGPWQSFTAPVSGTITSFDIGATDGFTPSSVSFRIRDGEGASGTILYSGTITIGTTTQYYTATISSPPSITAGNKYTIEFSSVATVGYAVASGDPYSGGRSSEGASQDLQFSITYNASASSSDLILSQTGGVQLTGLSGSGNEMVSVDPSGNLSRQPIPTGGDNLGNHIMDSALTLNNFGLRNTVGSVEGLTMRNNGNVKIGGNPAAPSQPLVVQRNQNTGSYVISANTDGTDGAYSGFAVQSDLHLMYLRSYGSANTGFLNGSPLADASVLENDLNAGRMIFNNAGNAPFIWGINGAERMRLTSAGLSIGIPANQYTLPNADGTAGQVMVTNGAGTLTWVDTAGWSGAGGSLGGSGNTNEVAFWNTSDTLTSSSDLAYDPVNSRLGIGISAPNHKLQVEGNTGEDVVGLFKRLDNTRRVGVQFDPTGSISSNNPRWKMGIFPNTSTWELVSNDGSVDATRMIVDTTGYLGLGSSALPKAQLHLQGPAIDASLSNAQMIIGSTSGTNLALDNNELMARDNGAEATLNLNSEGGDFFVHYNQAAGTDFAVLDNGNVGIGTKTPTRKLEVLAPGYGIQHTDGTIELSTYVGGDAGWLGTETMHNLSFYTNSGGAVLTVDTLQNVGVGTTDPDGRFHAVAKSGQDYAIYAEASNNSGTSAAIFARHNGTTQDVTGVWGENSSTGDFAAGVYGRSLGTSGRTIGVYGRTYSDGNEASGVYGLSQSSTGVTYGVWGWSNGQGNGAAGVYGYTEQNATVYGVKGELASANTTAGAAAVYANSRSSNNTTLAIKAERPNNGALMEFIAGGTSEGAFAVGPRGMNFSDDLRVNGDFTMDAAYNAHHQQTPQPLAVTATDYTIAADDHTVILNPGTNIAVFLPQIGTAACPVGRILEIRNIADGSPTAPLSVQASSGQQIITRSVGTAVNFITLDTNAGDLRGVRMMAIEGGFWVILQEYRP